VNRKHNTLPEGQSVVSIRLPSELHERLRATAKRNDRAVAQEVRRAITLHIERETEQATA
jgi:predicted DNA-binding protein